MPGAENFKGRGGNIALAGARLAPAMRATVSSKSAPTDYAVFETFNLGGVTSIARAKHGYHRKSCESIPLYRS